jgi:hypothetical protein
MAVQINPKIAVSIWRSDRPLQKHPGEDASTATQACQTELQALALIRQIMQASFYLHAGQWHTLAPEGMVFPTIVLKLADSLQLSLILVQNPDSANLLCQGFVNSTD